MYPPYIVLAGVAAATLGDNLGYLLGRKVGRPLLDRYRRFLHISPGTIALGERLFEHRGAPVVFFARFITGLRIIAGPLAGILHMRWKRFAIFNFLGAVAWVTTIVAVGYFFGSEFETLLRWFGWGGIVLLIAVAAATVVLLRWHRRRTARQHR